MNTRLNRTPGTIQFRLSYLIYLTAVAALGFAILRSVLDIRGGWQLNAVMMIYLGVLLAYFGIRVPLLFRRYRRGKRRDEARRADLARLVDQARRVDEGESGER
jgi:hypothetical protein